MKDKFIILFHIFLIVSCMAAYGEENNREQLAIQSVTLQTYTKGGFANPIKYYAIHEGKNKKIIFNEQVNQEFLYSLFALKSQIRSNLKQVKNGKEGCLYLNVELDEVTNEIIKVKLKGWGVMAPFTDTIPDPKDRLEVKKIVRNTFLENDFKKGDMYLSLSKDEKLIVDNVKVKSDKELKLFWVGVKPFGELSK